MAEANRSFCHHDIEHLCAVARIAMLLNMEEKTGCVSRDLQLRKAMGSIAELAEQLIDHPDMRVAELAGKIRSCAAGIEE